MNMLHELLREDYLSEAGPVYHRLRIAAHCYSQHCRDGRLEGKAFMRLCLAARGFAQMVQGWRVLGMSLDDLAPEWCSRQRQLMEAALDAYHTDPHMLNEVQAKALVERLKAAAIAA